MMSDSFLGVLRQLGYYFDTVIRCISLKKCHENVANGRAENALTINKNTRIDLGNTMNELITIDRPT